MPIFTLLLSRPQMSNLNIFNLVHHLSEEVRSVTFSTFVCPGESDGLSRICAAQTTLGLLVRGDDAFLKAKGLEAPSKSKG